MYTEGRCTHAGTPLPTPVLLPACLPALGTVPGDARWWNGPQDGPRGDHENDATHSAQIHVSQYLDPALNLQAALCLAVLPVS